ncbi:MAG: lipoate--protein ligase family protein [Chloroflexi bacterium]|nr:lipoate--protein ligase family protein [Chloroflexota bacterium]
MRQWRLIYDYPTAGSVNMAVDEAILQVVGAGQSFPTLRLYAWKPPCLSLGYGQKAADVDFARLAALGWDVVRRPTGGRAILHTDELTYSVALPAGDDIAAGSVVESYRRISHALVAGLVKLGVRPEADQRADRIGASGPVCFETPSHYEITVGGRKLIGSAQVRRKDGVLQHGSLPLYGDLGRICDALVYANDAEREAAKVQVRARAATLCEALNGQCIDWQTAADAIAQGFSETFEIEFTRAALLPAERADAERLATGVYGNEAYTRRR